MSNIYKYTITPGPRSAASVTLVSSSDNIIGLKFKGTDAKNFSGWIINVEQVEFQKELYRPNSIELRLMITENSKAPKLSAIQTLFEEAKLTLAVCNGNAKNPVATDYVFYDMEPIISAENCILNLTAYSPDYLMTLDSYSKTYMAAKLGGDIIASHELVKDGTVPYEYTPKTLVFNKVDTRNYEERKQSSSKHDKSAYNESAQEFKIPYTMQYNEDFYRFLTRQAHRMGEMLYFENNKLKLGVNEEVQKITLQTENFINIRVPNLRRSKLSTHSTQYAYSSMKNSPQDTLPFDMDFAADCALDAMKKEWDSGWLYTYFDWQKFARKTILSLSGFSNTDEKAKEPSKSFVTKDNIIPFLTKTASNAARMALDAMMKRRGAEDAFKAGLDNSKADNPLFNSDEQESDNYLRPFASMTQDDEVKINKKKNAEQAYAKQVETVKKKKEKLDKQNTYPQASECYDSAFGAIKDLYKQVNKFNAEILEGVTLSDYGTLSDLLELSDDLQNMKTMFKSTTSIKLNELKNPDISGEQEDLVVYNDGVKKALEDGEKQLILFINSQELKKDSSGNPTSEIETANNRLNMVPLHRHLQISRVCLDRLKDGYEVNGKKEIVGIQAYKNKWLGKDKKLDKALDTFINSMKCAKGKSHEYNQAVLIREKIKEGLNTAYKQIEDGSKYVTTVDKQFGDKCDENSYKDLIRAAAEYNSAEKKLKDLSDDLDKIVLEYMSSNLFSTFYYNIQHAEDAQSGKVVKVLLSTEFAMMPRLGGKVKYDDKEYIITKVHGAQYSAGGGLDRMEMEMVPLVKMEGKEDKLYAIPPTHECRQSNKCGMQLATVTNNNDPMKMGRVRVKYHWQAKDDTGATPWIRMASPWATHHKAGIYFSPNIGDEVLVDFYNGCPERPLVMGAVNNAQNPHAGGGSTSIINTNGQQINMKGYSVDDGGTMFNSLVSVLPGPLNLLSYFPGTDALTGKISKYTSVDGLMGVAGADVENSKFAGGIVMKDQYDTWKIEGSTTGRSVTISSTYGTVSIDAFTGISINCPTGDLSINAKNISIKAANNISIESGAEIARQRKLHKTAKKTSLLEQAFNGISEFVGEHLTVAAIDFEALRTLKELIYAPVEGTLEIKSNRNLMLSAGQGTPSDPSLGFVYDYDKDHDAASVAGEVDPAVTFLNGVKGRVNALVAGFQEKAKAFTTNKEAYINSLTGLGVAADKIKKEDSVFNNTPDSYDANTFDLTSYLTEVPNELTLAGYAQAQKTAIISSDTATDEQKNAVQNLEGDALKNHFKGEFQAQIKPVYDNAKATKDVLAKYNDEQAWFDQIKTQYGDLKFKMKQATGGADVEKDNEALFRALITHIKTKVGEDKTKDYMQDKAFLEDLRRVTILKIISSTGLYQYKQENGQAYVDELWNDPKNASLLSNITSLLGKSKNDIKPDNNFASSADYGMFTGANAETNNAKWKVFTHCCQHYTVGFLNAHEGKESSGQKVGNYLLGISGIAGLIEGAQSMCTPQSEITALSAKHDGRIILSDQEGITVTLDKDGKVVTTKAQQGEWA